MANYCSNIFLFAFIFLSTVSSQESKGYLFIRAVKDHHGVSVVQIKKIPGKLKELRKPELRKDFGDFEISVTDKKGLTIWSARMPNPQVTHAPVSRLSQNHNFHKKEVLSESMEFVIRIPIKEGMDEIQFYQRDWGGKEDTGLFKKVVNKKLLGKHSLEGN